MSAPELGRGPADAALPSHIPSASACSYPVRAGNALRALIDGEPAFRRICEAVQSAKNSVWVTVAFLYPDFRMPDGRTVFDVLDAAKARGIDVRVIFWRTDRADSLHFHGREDDHAMLAARGSRFKARWDRAQKHYCQHQKSWLIDAGTPDEIAFVGGINLDPMSVSAPGHAGRDGEHIHDVYLELRGPSASDVHHNFAQRWNEASERRSDRGTWSHSHEDVLKFPTRASAAAGNSIVQMQRTVRAGHYFDTAPAPGAERYDIGKGEFSVFEQYVKAIDAAKRTVYIEDQYLAPPDIIEHLHAALARGVDVVYLAPADPERQVKDARLKPSAKAFFERLAALAGFDHFALVGIAAPQTNGTLENVYVHAKIMMVDDCWATIGSCNIASQSFFCDTELNAAIWDEDFVRDLRATLLKEHLGLDTSRMEDRDAMRLYREAARENAQRRHRGEKMNGLAFALDPAMYGM
ncbi:MAG: phosphatidylserine/phosphatidylglycerophosphate/cardiolipin synthase family protein [Proteobacteria bacterium]|nr:phosphatidylserine/phosphatidylglycerophosphate/cardiolipin synthase family protein [Pseudomonadota bacterium]